MIQQVANRAKQPKLAHLVWLQTGYRPTPTIIEAAQALYHGHQVVDIIHHEAHNLGATTDVVSHLIDNARLHNMKVICFLSGVPGAGKTLAGLNLVCQRRKKDSKDQEHAVFLSGNGPLVKVLQEALTRDAVAQASLSGKQLSKSKAHREAVAFIQNIHHFRDEYVRVCDPPIERVVIFDEAQRAWNREQASKFMKKKDARLSFDQSEPTFLISVMDRHPSWAVIVCLVGGGQEINTGEAGIEEWLIALRDHFPHWHVHVPEQIETTEYLPRLNLDELEGRIFRKPLLHLDVSLRSFRSEGLSAGIAALMNREANRAASELATIIKDFPIVITRSVIDAKNWARHQARGSERFGLLASSGARRLKPHGIFVQLQIDPCMWFLNPDSDVRSSYYLEDAATEFDVQGLELDWTVVVWDGDLIYSNDDWRYRAFKGSRWHDIHGEYARRYKVNAYRVLLTRARQGMVIVVPEGDSADQTRSPHFYDPTWYYLRSLGIPELGSAGETTGVR